ncbi:MAG: hypothetical protein ACOYM3_06965 [Terrimicrobiaceae bacterium]
MSEEAKPSVLLSRGFPGDPATPDFSGWFTKVPLRSPAATAATSPSPPRPTPFPAGATRARPSDAGHSSLPGAALFAESAGLAFGTEVHEALAEIEWFPIKSLASPLSPTARGILELFLGAPEIAPVFERPSPQSEAWRERSVACRLDDTTYSAQMDRVVVTPPGGGKKGQILLVDFKTDQGDPDEIAARYRPQLEIYARILAAWSGGEHEIIAAVATVRKPALVRVC